MGIMDEVMIESVICYPEGDFDIEPDAPPA